MADQRNLRVAPLNSVEDVRREAGRVYREQRRGVITAADARASKELLRLIADLLSEADWENRLARVEEVLHAPRTH